MERRILHVDFNAFYASVACLLDPTLSDQAVAVAGDPEMRHGIILAKNELAKRFGVKTGEAIWQARQKCPMLVTVKPDFSAYHHFSARGRAIYREYSDRVEPFGLDESWLDITPITSGFSDARDIAEDIRLRVKQELGITVSVGVAPNKVFAKLGSDMKKPDAVTLITPDNFRETVWPLPVSDLLFVGRATATRLHRMGVETIGELAALPEFVLDHGFGKVGRTLHDFANGADASPVERTDASHEAKSVGNGITSSHDLMDERDVYTVIVMLAESVAERLRANGQRARTVQLSVRDAELHIITRQGKLSDPSDLTMEIAARAMALFREHYAWRVPVRSLTVSTTELCDAGAPAQLSLLTDETRRERMARAEAAVDGIRGRFGHCSIARALLLQETSISERLDEHAAYGESYQRHGECKTATG